MGSNRHLDILFLHDSRHRIQQNRNDLQAGIVPVGGLLVMGAKPTLSIVVAITWER